MEKKSKEIVLAGEIIFILAIFITFLFLLKPIFIGFAIYESQPNLTIGKDTYIKQNLNSTNYGNAVILSVGKDSQNRESRSLIQLEVGEIPQGTILDAKLNLVISYSSTENNFTVKAYRLNFPWEEIETTWTNKTASSLWGNGGGDYGEEIDSVIFSNASNSYNFTITDAVRGWVNGSYNNYGLIFIASNAGTGERRELISSDSTNESYRPKLIVDYTQNAVPTIINISTNTNSTNFKSLGEDVEFSVSWQDLEGDSVTMYVCDSSSISTSGCQYKTFCSVSPSKSNPLECSYKVDNSGNKTSLFYCAVCDGFNCSLVNQSYFYINRPPSIKIINPNGGETINQSLGEYRINFNVSDKDNDLLIAKIYYGSTPNSTDHTINSNVNLTQFCTDSDSLTSTTNNCSYSWDSSGLYGNFYLTIKVNDEIIETTNTSSNVFYVRSISDPTPPQVYDFWTEEDIPSGKDTYFYANVSDNLLVNKVWVSINTTPQTNITLSNNDSQVYNGSWIATYPGSYTYRVYAEDIAWNLNDSLVEKNFTIRSPTISYENVSYPSVILPYYIIKVNGLLKANDSLRGVYAYLTVPEGFEFLEGYSQNYLLGNFSYNESKNVSWFLSAPITEGDYNLSITYTDQYGNSWLSSIYNLTVNSNIGGYQINLEGYPEVQAGSAYYSEANFKKGGLNLNADEVKISIYDPLGNLLVGPIDMMLKEIGVYNYTYQVPALQTNGQMETRINATKDSISYYTNSFWNLVGALFDVRNIAIVNPAINKLNISVICENKGSGSADLTLNWNLTRVDTGELLDSGAETFAVGSTPLTKYYSPTTDYVGQVKITVLGRYSKTESAGAFEVFSTMPATQDISYQGGGGGSKTEKKEEIANLVVKFDEIIYLARSTPKTVKLTVENTGTKNLTNLYLSLRGIDPLFYSIPTDRISLLKAGESKSLEIKFLVTAALEELNFYYDITSEEITKQGNSKIVVISTLDYLQKEIQRIYERVEYLEKRINNKKTKAEFTICLEMVEEAKNQINSEEYINAGEKIKEIDNCLEKVTFLLNTGSQAFSMSNLQWTLVYLSIIIMAVITIVTLKKLKDRTEIIEFLGKKEEKPKESEKEQIKKDKDFEKKINKINKRLED